MGRGAHTALADEPDGVRGRPGATDGHLKVWNVDPADETLLTSLGVAGNFTPPADGSAEVRLNGRGSADVVSASSSTSR